MKTKFKNKASVTHIGKKLFRLNEPLTIYSNALGIEVTAPKGFLTDFASIPWFAQSFVQVLGNNIRSAIIHDWLCTNKGKEKTKLTQKQADALFLEGLKIDEVRWGKARIMAAGVRGFQRTKYFFKRGKSYG